MNVEVVCTVREFVPTLIQTIDYEPVRWSDLEFILNDEFRELADKSDVDGIYERIKDWSADFGSVYKEEFVKERIRDFIHSYRGASGVIAVREKLYQLVILAILDTFSDR